MNEINSFMQLLTHDDTTEGKVAYIKYHNIMQQLSDLYGMPVDKVTAAFVALSPNNDYYGNLRSVVSCLTGIKNKTCPDNITVTTFNACKYRALSYLDGTVDFLAATKGRKTRSFYHNILDPECCKHITIDGHMVAIWFGEDMTMREAATRRWKYDTLEIDFKYVASENGLVPCQLQAILWLARKRYLSIKYNDHPDLFIEQGGLNTDVDVAAIRAYGPKKIDSTSIDIGTTQMILDL